MTLDPTPESESVATRHAPHFMRCILANSAYHSESLLSHLKELILSPEKIDMQKQLRMKVLHGSVHHGSTGCLLVMDCYEYHILTGEITHLTQTKRGSSLSAAICHCYRNGIAFKMMDI